MIIEYIIIMNMSKNIILYTRSCMSKLSLILLYILFININGYAQDKVDPPEFEYTRHYNDFVLKHEFDNIFYKKFAYNIKELNPNVGIELFYNFELPKTLIENLSKEEIDKILYNILTSLSTRKEIEYYSDRDKVYKPFFDESYTVQSLKETNRIEDFMVSKDENIPISKQLYAYQKDASSGKNINQITVKYDAFSHQFYLNIENTKTSTFLGVIPISDPHMLRVTFLINREGNKVSMYSVIATKAKLFKKLREEASKDMRYRIYALSLGFDRQVNKALSLYK